MYVTTRFIGTERGKMKYLFFFLTEDYIESQVRIMQSIEPLLIKLSSEIGQEGALVRPFRNFERDTLGDVMRKEWSTDNRNRLSKTPGILIIDKDFDSFDPQRHKWLHISLRGLINSSGDVQIFELKNLFTLLIGACKEGNILDIPNTISKKSSAKDLWDSVELKPGVCGISIDLKKAMEFLWGIVKKKA